MTEAGGYKLLTIILLIANSKVELHTLALVYYTSIIIALFSTSALL